MKAARLLCVVVTHNNAATIARCLGALTTQHEVELDFCVVDNQSTDETLARIRQAFPATVVQANDANVGFGRAVNDAVRVAALDRYSHVLLVNPDAYLEATAARALVEASAAQPRWGALGGLGLREDGSVDPTSCLARPSLRQAVSSAVALHRWPGFRRLDSNRIGAVFVAQPGVVPAVAGSVVLIPIEAWRAVGGFDPAFFLYGEDVDLCCRLLQAGWASGFVPDCRYVHARGTSSPDPSMHELRMLSGRALLYRRQLGPLRGRIAIAATVFGVGVRHFAAAVLRRRSRWTLSWQHRRVWRAGRWPG
ncbi:MAG: glycosyltransferase family 2 protein [Actinomycetota bacterium]